jgi:hypothetical protein
MNERKWLKLEELRQPGMRRVLEAMKLIEEERPGLIEQASLAAQLMGDQKSGHTR